MLSVLTSTHMLVAARDAGTKRFFYSSSACVYDGSKQQTADVTALKEADAYPAEPEDGYGWEKLFSERMCRHFREDFGLADPRRPLPQRLRPARHVGRRPREGARRDLPQGRPGQAERRPRRSRSGATASRRAASCTSTTASAARRRSWPATTSSRSTSASAELVTINQMATILEDIAGITLERSYDLDAPAGRPGPQQRQHDVPLDLRLGAVDLAGHRPRGHLPMDLRPAQREVLTTHEDRPARLLGPSVPGRAVSQARGSRPHGRSRLLRAVRQRQGTPRATGR